MSSTPGPGPRYYGGRAAVVPLNAQAPEPVEDVGVVAVADERLGVGHGKCGVEVRDDEDLVIPADRGEDRADTRVGECRVHVCGPGLRGRTQLARRRILDRNQTRERFDPAQRLLMQRRGDGRGSEGGREDGDAVSGDERGC